MCARRFQLPLPTLPSSSEPRPFRSEVYQQAGCAGTGHKLNSQKCVFMGGRCLLPTRVSELEPSYTRIEGRWKSLYSTQIHVSSGPMLTHAFLQHITATNMRLLAALSTVRQDEGGIGPELSSHREACLEASSQLAAFLCLGEGSSILSQEVPRLPFYCAWR